MSVARDAVDLGYPVTLFHYRPELAELAPSGTRRLQLSRPNGGRLRAISNLSPAAIRRVGGMMTAEAAAIAIVSQGNIETGIRGLLAARSANLATISYTPFGYPMSHMAARWGVVRDLVDRPAYRLPHAWITTSEYHARLLRMRTRRDVRVVPPSISITPSSPRPKVREASRIDIAVVGRISFRHKNQGILPDVVRALRSAGVAAHVHVIGDGADAERLRSDVQAADLFDTFTFWGWQSPASVQAIVGEHAHVWLIPSHFEGAPRVLLEAASLGIPFVVSRLDCLEDYDIPSAMLADANDAVGMARGIITVASESFADVAAATNAAIVRSHSRARAIRALEVALDSQRLRGAAAQESRGRHR